MLGLFDMARATVEMEDEVFSPIRKTAAPGTTVVWTNTGSVDHVVESV